VREPTIARNYADALFALAERDGQTVPFGDLIDAVAGAIRADDTVRIVLESPRVPKEQKQRLLADALQGRAPDVFVRFLTAVVRRGRQGLLGAIAREYLSLVDVKFNRVHASVAVAREPDPTLEREIRTRLTALLDMQVIPHFRHDPGILGGVIVRVGDRVMDGSLRRKMLALRRAMLGA
jgi:F-type H+-transporting ATPase subunit delta